MIIYVLHHVGLISYVVLNPERCRDAKFRVSTIYMCNQRIGYYIHKLAGLFLSNSHLIGLLTIYSLILSKEPSARMIWS